MDNDFYLWMNSKWINNNPIPENESSWGNFDILTHNNMLKLQEILTNSNIDKPARLNTLYYQLQQNYNNLSELNYYFNQIDNVKNINELMKLFVDYTLLFNLNGIISYSVEPDYNNTSKYILHVESSKFGLPSRDYYFSSNKENDRNKYKLFMKEYTLLFGLELNIDKLYYFEELLASKIFNSIENGDMNLINNKRTFNQIQNDLPNIAYMIEYLLIKINKSKQEINLENVKYCKLINELLNNNLLSCWKDFIKYKLCLSTYYFINESIEISYNNFYKKYILGAKKIKPKWERILDIIINLIGQDLGILYVKYYYDPTINDNMLFIINQIKNQIRKAILNNTWLEQNTINRAITKIDNIDIKIGYPSSKSLENYDLLNLNSNLFINILQIIYFNNNLKFKKLYNIKNKDKWHMHSFIVNAYYSPLNNEIVFPAGILQEPFYYKDNIIKTFGGIGYIIGHEIIHAFDNRGRLFNENGNLENWWTQNDNNKYLSKTLKVINQYNSCKVNNQFVNGELTLGENIADLGGTKFALMALIEYLKKNNIYNIDLLKNFFYNYGRIFASNIREEKQNLKLLTDYHAPHIVRVNNVLKNIDEFYEVFNIKNGEMYLPKNERISIW